VTPATPAKQRLTLPGYLRTLAAGMQRLGVAGALTPQERASAERHWAQGGRPGAFARAVKRARSGRGTRRPQRVGRGRILFSRRRGV
jgi:hypothetical protein